MISGYRLSRLILLLLLGIATLALSLSIEIFGVFYGIFLLIGAALTSVYLFLHFDQNIDEKIIIELAIDGFAGLIIFTYPEPNERFIMLDFSFWIAIMGILHVVSGLFNKKNSKLIWLYILSGIIMVVLGFIILNYNTEYIGSIGYLIGFVLTYYGGLGIYLLTKSRKNNSTII